MSFALLIRLSRILYNSSSSSYQSSLEKSFYLPNILHQIRSDLAHLQTQSIFCTGEVQGIEHICPSIAPICQLERDFSRVTAVSCAGSSENRLQEWDKKELGIGRLKVQVCIHTFSHSPPQDEIFGTYAKHRVENHITYLKSMNLDPLQ